MYGSIEHVEALRGERYGRHARTAPSPRVAGIRSIERVVKMVGRGKQTSSATRAA